MGARPCAMLRNSRLPSLPKRITRLDERHDNLRFATQFVDQRIASRRRRHDERLTAGDADRAVLRAHRNAAAVHKVSNMTAPVRLHLDAVGELIPPHVVKVLRVRRQVNDAPPVAAREREMNSRATRSPARSKYRFSNARRMFSDRGFPSRSMRIQSYILNVKMYGVALISSTRLPTPEQWIVPLGIRNRSCFFAGQL